MEQSDKSAMTQEYATFLGELKQRIASARLSAAHAVNQDLILLYWDIGRGIVEKQEALGWGESVVEALAKDLQKAFPGASGFSARNLWDMRRFYSAYTDAEFLRQAVAELDKLKRSKDLPHRDFLTALRNQHKFFCAEENRELDITLIEYGTVPCRTTASCGKV